MTGLRWGRIGAAALLACAALQAGAANAPPASAYSAGVATEWFALALQIGQQTPGFSAPVTSRALAYLGLALHESVAPGMPAPSSLAGQLTELASLPTAQPDEPLHWPTVANAALAAMTRMMFPTASADNKQRIDLLERSLPLKLGTDFDPAAITIEIGQRSETFGKLMAMALVTWARTDGGHEAWAAPRRERDPAAYVPPSGPGQWTATPPGFARALLPWWGANRPFALAAASDCAAQAPPPYSEQPGSAFHTEGREVWQLSLQATQPQRQAALYWADDAGRTPTPAGHWVFIATDLLKARKASLADAATTYARLNIALADAFIAAWNTKYSVNLLRPVTYVQLVFDSNWVPALMDTPPFPEYPSGHSVVSAAAAAVLSARFGAGAPFTDNTHNDRGWGPRSFASFAVAADEAALSRLYAGIHFRSGVDGGKRQGQCVAAKALALRIAGENRSR